MHKAKNQKLRANIVLEDYVPCNYDRIRSTNEYINIQARLFAQSVQVSKFSSSIFSHLFNSNIRRSVLTSLARGLTSSIV